MDGLVVERRIRSQHDLPVCPIVDEPLDCGLVVNDGEDDIVGADVPVIAIHDDVVTVFDLSATDLRAIHGCAVGLDRVETRRLGSPHQVPRDAQEALKVLFRKQLGRSTIRRTDDRNGEERGGLTCQAGA